MRRRVVLLGIGFAFLICLAASARTAHSSPDGRAEASKPLTNQDIVQMVRARLADSTILKAIQVSDADFDLSAAALVKLKNAGVSQSVIVAMLSAANSKDAAPPPPVVITYGIPPRPPAKSADLPDDVGVYVRRDGKLVEIDPEIVNWRTGGVLKNVATLGLDKGHINGTVLGPHSKLHMAGPGLGMTEPLEFYIRCTEGDSASEYQLLRFWDKGDRREFRAMTGGVLHSSGGAEDNAVPFSFEKVAPRIYKVEIYYVGTGEFGFLAPGALTSSNIASQGKIYTFEIVE